MIGVDLPTIERTNTMSTKEELIAKAIEVHGDRYDYSQVDYVNPRTKVSIICRNHGVFLQDLYAHAISGHGCPTCGVETRTRKTTSNTEEFVTRAKEVHGDRYGYEKTRYVNNHTKVAIDCTVHGTFWQTPNGHLLNQGCPKCGGRFQLTTEEFIANAKKIHGDLYDYSESKYTVAKAKIKIICRKHGPFHQIAANHTSGMGCPLCITRVIVDTEEFIERAKATHGDTYDYSKSKYVDSRAMVIIGCKVHGDFEQAASEHIRGRGCRKCASEERGAANRLLQDDFVTRANKVHNNKYDYSMVDYQTCKTPVKIICPVHGPFYQNPVNHTGGSGCKICKSSKGELAIAKILDKHGIEFTTEYRIPSQVYRWRYDFYLPDYNLIVEYHGFQHYHIVDFFGGESGLTQRKQTDALKKLLAKKCSYKYLEIKYTHFVDVPSEDFEKNLLLNLQKFGNVAKKTVLG